MGPLDGPAWWVFVIKIIGEPHDHQTKLSLIPKKERKSDVWPESINKTGSK